MKVHVFFAVQLFAIALCDKDSEAAYETLLGIGKNIPATSDVCFSAEHNAGGRSIIQDLLTAGSAVGIAFDKARVETDHMARIAEYQDALVNVNKLIDIMQFKIEPQFAKAKVEAPPCIIDDFKCDHQLIDSTGALVNKDLMILLKDSMTEAANITNPADCEKIYTDDFLETADLICDMKKLATVVQACLSE